MLVAHLGLDRLVGRGARGVRTVLERLRCIQIDPLDSIGTNADLVVIARVDGVSRGELWRHLFPRHAFEHFAKERCILPARAFPWYRQRGHAAQVSWWRHGEREKLLPPQLVTEVLSEIETRGPVSARELSDHGSVKPLDWGGWKGTARATTMAIELLWTRCDIVVSGRTEHGAKLYDVPVRAIGSVATEIPQGHFGRWALLERVNAAGLLSRAGGSNWSMLSEFRTSPLVGEMIEQGDLVEVIVEGSSRPYLAVPEFLRPRAARYDNRVRILGPLDPLLWDRNLIRTAFEFDYVWEVYKPEALRRWGWYVCPLLHRDRLIGRIDAKVEGSRFVVRKLWLDDTTDPSFVRPAIDRHAEACGCDVVRMPKRITREGR